ncbi:MAG: hypothetical protein ABSB19_02300 [Methylomonas sp.]|jgi:hypothetical protein
MKSLIVLFAILFTLPILLVAGFQLIGLIAIELRDLAKEAWRSPDAQSAG